MVTVVPDILARIVESKRLQLAADVGRRTQLEKRAIDRRDFRNFRAALTTATRSVIAEIKKTSPSKGTLSENFDPSTIARTYRRGGASALSVLTDLEFFGG